MNNLTWRELMQPAYVLTFIRGFLLAAIPSGGLTHTTQNGFAAASVLPNLISVMVALGMGLLGGLEQVRALSTAPPALLAPKP